MIITSTGLKSLSQFFCTGPIPIPLKDYRLYRPGQCTGTRAYRLLGVPFRTYLKWVVVGVHFIIIFPPHSLFFFPDLYQLFMCMLFLLYLTTCTLLVFTLLNVRSIHLEVFSVYLIHYCSPPYLLKK